LKVPETIFLLILPKRCFYASFLLGGDVDHAE
jgi:hypothetical protein